MINNIQFNLNNKTPIPGDVIITSEGNIYIVYESFEGNQEVFGLVDLKTGKIIKDGRIRIEYVLDNQILKKKAFRVISKDKIIISEQNE